jgi:hypothetical protein
VIAELFRAINRVLVQAHEDGSLYAPAREGAWRPVGRDERGNMLYAPPPSRPDPWAIPRRR